MFLFKIFVKVSSPASEVNKDLKASSSFQLQIQTVCGGVGSVDLLGGSGLTHLPVRIPGTHHRCLGVSVELFLVIMWSANAVRRRNISTPRSQRVVCVTHAEHND